MPVLLALTAIVGTSGLVALVSQIVPIDDIALPAIMLIGLAVGIDYSLFYIRREREERAKGASKLEAIDIAAATSGRAVLISGLTVIAAMAGMLLTGNTIFISMGLATILVIAVAVIGSLTVLPAVLAALGDKLEKVRIPFIGKRQSQARESRFWGFVTDRVMRHPIVAIVVAGGALVALSLPALGMQTKLPGIESYSKDQPGIETYLKIQKAFPAEADFATVVVKAKDVKAADVQSAIARLKPAEVEINPKGTVAKVNVHLAGSGVDDEAMASLEQLREHTIPAALQGRQRLRRRDRRRRRHRRLQRDDAPEDPDRVRLRPRALVPAAAGHVPLDRDPDQGDHAQPAVGRRVLRAAHAGLPGASAARPSRAGSRCSCS